MTIKIENYITEDGDVGELKKHYYDGCYTYLMVCKEIDKMLIFLKDSKTIDQDEYKHQSQGYKQITSYEKFQEYIDKLRMEHITARIDKLALPIN